MNASDRLLVWRLSRTSGATPDPASAARRAQSFVGASGSLRSATLLVSRDDRGMSSFLVADPGRRGTGADQAALHLAQAVAARAEKVDEPPELSSVRSIGTLVARKKSVATRDNQAGDDPGEVARRMAVAMRPGSWVAAVTRPALQRERKRTLRWYEFRLGTKSPVHHVTNDHAVAVHFVAGGDSRSEVRSMLRQMVAVLPGFDIDTRTRFASSVGPYSLLAGVSAALLAAVWFLAPVNVRTAALATVAAVVLLMLASMLSGLLPTRRRYQLRQVATAAFKPPDKRLLPPKRPRPAGTNKDGKQTDGDPGDYPLDRDVFLMGPSVVVGLVAPQAGAASGAASTSRRDAPGTLIDPSVGPLIGVAGESDTPVHLPAASLSDGIAMVGRKGSGKSIALRLLYAWMALDRVSPSRIPGAPGERCALVAFESKGEGAEAYQKWANTVGDRALLVDLADPSTPVVDIFAVPGTFRQKLAYIIDALVYAFEPGEIQGRSAEALSAAFAGALLVGSPSMRNTGLPPGCPPGRSPIFYAHVLLGGYGDERAVALAATIAEGAALAERTKASDAEDLADAEGQLAVLFGSASTKVTPSQRATLAGAARNKLRYLAAAEAWWDPSRRKVTWRQVLDGTRSIIVNTGVSTGGDLVDDKTVGYMSSLLMFSLRDAIMRYCNGWDAAGRHVAIFSDELSLLAGSTPEVIAWCQDKGRSYGVVPIFATQRLDQLPVQVQKVMRDFGTAYWFAQRDPEVATIAAKDLSVDMSEWTPEDIKNLPPYTAVLRTQVAGVPQPPVPVRLVNAEADMPGFAATQRAGMRPEPATDEAGR